MKTKASAPIGAVAISAAPAATSTDGAALRGAGTKARLRRRHKASVVVVM